MIMARCARFGRTRSHGTENPLVPMTKPLYIKQSFIGVPLIKKAEDGEVVDMAEGEEEKRPMTLQGEVTMKSQNLQDPM